VLMMRFGYFISPLRDWMIFLGFFIRQKLNFQFIHLKILRKVILSNSLLFFVRRTLYSFNAVNSLNSASIYRSRDLRSFHFIIYKVINFYLNYICFQQSLHWHIKLLIKHFRSKYKEGNLKIIFVVKVKE